MLEAENARRIFKTHLLNTHSCPRNFAMLRLLIAAPRPNVPMTFLFPLDVHLLEVNNCCDPDDDEQARAEVDAQYMP